MEYRDALWIAHCYFQESIFSLIPFYCKCKFINLFIILSWNMNLFLFFLLFYLFISTVVAHSSRFSRVLEQINKAKCLATSERQPPALAEIVVCSFKFAPAETDSRAVKSGSGWRDRSWPGVGSQGRWTEPRAGHSWGELVGICPSDGEWRMGRGHGAALNEDHKCSAAL